MRQVPPPPAVLAFGTYDKTSHPRVEVLIDGLRARGFVVEECNVPLPLSTADRVAILQHPRRLPMLAGQIGRCWTGLARQVRARRHRSRPDETVLVGYLGHFDVLLARALFPHHLLVLDHLVSAAGTATDRGEQSRVKQRLLAGLDHRAIAAADVVVVDTPEHGQLVGPRHADRVVVVPVGAPDWWFRSDPPPRPPAETPVEVVFFGLFTPLQGTVTVARALASLADEAGVRATMVGAGQDLAAARAAVGDGRVTWLSWLRPAELVIRVQASHVCLGIFGSSDKAGRVVPNKVYQGAAAGCAVVTSDTAPQRRALGDAAVLVPTEDPEALAAALRDLASDRDRLQGLRLAAWQRANEAFRSGPVVEALAQRIGGGATVRAGGR